MPCSDEESERRKQMPNIIDHVSYLSEEIGPRPAGTEEEQQAALYVTEFMQKEAGLSTSVEDFTATSNVEMAKIVCDAVLILSVVLGLAVPQVGIVAVVLAIAAAALLVLEALDKPVLSNLFGKGISQNVVAKYEPAYDGENASSRRRKIVLVANYDSGKVRAELNGPVFGILPAIKLASLACTVVVPILLLVRAVALADATGAAPVVVSVITVIALIVAILPLVAAIIHRSAAYNAAANCNASGVAVLMEAAARVGRPSAAESDEAAPNVVIHGEGAARDEGLIPDGVRVVYDVPETPADSAQARLAQAKAAVAAISGKPVPGAAASFDIAANLAQPKDKPLEAPTDADIHAFRAETMDAFAPRVADAAQAVQEQIAAQARAAEQRVSDAVRSQEASPIEGYLDKAAADAAPAPSEAPAPEPVVVQEAPQAAFAPEASNTGVPDWFARAQEKAKRPKDDGKPVHRSRYADALDAAVSESSVHFKEANDAIVSETEQRLAAMRDSIREVKAPGFEDAPAPQVSSVLAEERELIVEETIPAVPEWSMPTWDMAAPRSNEPSETSEPLTVPVVEADATPLDAPKEQKPAVCEDAPAASAPPQKSPAAAPTTEDYATTAMPPIDVSDLREAEASAPAAASEPVAPFVAPLAAEAARPRELNVPAIPQESLTPVAELTKQRAPLADASKGKKASVNLRAQIPSILSPSKAVSEEESSPKSEKHASALRNTLPSLSGSITRENNQSEPDKPQSDATVALAAAGTFAPASATGSFAPIDEEIFENVDPDELYVDDADDSDYEGSITETGAFAGPGYVEMPKSRVRRFFDKFHFGKHKQEDESTPQEWLDVDESFDARSVGAERGSWESFREENDTYVESDDASYGEEAADYESYDDGFDDYEDEDYKAGSTQKWNGGAFSRVSMGNANLRSGEEFEEVAALENEHTPAAEMEQIYRFHNPDITTEVWFVALGSELSGHAGMKAFLSEHAQELRGALIVGLDAMGAGELSLVESEGVVKKTRTSSRMKRFLKKATSATGLHVGSAAINWEDSSASIAAKQGFQAMHLAGIEGGKPAFYGQEDDVVANVDEQKLDQNAAFVVELLKNI